VGWIGGGALSWGEENLPLWICLWRAPLTRARGGPSVRVGQAIPLLGAAAFNGAAAGRLTSTH
jgi:hypothetical protein